MATNPTSPSIPTAGEAEKNLMDVKRSTPIAFLSPPSALLTNHFNRNYVIGLNGMTIAVKAGIAARK